MSVHRQEPPRKQAQPGQEPGAKSGAKFVAKSVGRYLYNLWATIVLLSLIWWAVSSLLRAIF